MYSTNDPSIASLTAHFERNDLTAMDPRIFDIFRQKCPLTHQALSGRRYLLPNKYQSLYNNQDDPIRRRILALLESVLAPEDSFPRQAELINLLAAWRYDLPTLYLDEDLAQVLLRTDLRPDFRTDDCRFPWPAFRLMTPLSLDLNDGNSEAKGELQYVDICLCEQGDVIGLEERFCSELQSLGNANELRRGFTHPTGAQFYACGLTVMKERMVFAHPWENKTLYELAKVDITSARPKSEQIRDLIFNVLILLSQYPARIQLEPLEVRRPKLKGAHLRPGLSKARFVSDMVEPRIVRPRHMILSMP